jgi:hypothetical protein
MRDITTASKYGPSYTDLIDSMEVENLLQVDDDDYQGDSRVLLRDGDRYGLLTFGWGSRSGCDALQAAEGNDTEVRELRDDLWRAIHWEDSAAALLTYIARTRWLTYIEGKDWSLDYSHDPEFLTQVRAKLAEVAP